MHKTIDDFKNKIIRGDCLQILQTMPSNSVDAVITDPPYSSGGLHKSTRSNQTTTAKYQLTSTKKQYADFEHDNKDQRSFGFWCMFWLSECYRILKPGGYICCFSDWRQLPTMTDLLQGGGYIWRGIVPWDKTESSRPSKGSFRNQCEYVVWGTKGGVDMDGPCMNGTVRQRVKPSEKFHLTGKPIEVLRMLIKCAWKDDAIILDPFAGSGTTCVAAYQNRKDYIGLELSKEYCEVARQRIKAEHDQMALFPE